jgi:hypothetical protein
VCVLREKEETKKEKGKLNKKTQRVAKLCAS